MVERTTTKPEIFQNQLDVEGSKYEVKVAEGADLKDFFAKHGEHYNMCLRYLQKNTMELVNKERQSNLKTITFMGKKYSN